MGLSPSSHRRDERLALDVRQEEVDEIGGAFSRRRRLESSLLNQSVRVDARFARLLDAAREPIFQLQMVDLGMELHADVTTDAEGLHRAR